MGSSVRCDDRVAFDCIVWEDLNYKAMNDVLGETYDERSSPGVRHTANGDFAESL